MLDVFHVQQHVVERVRLIVLMRVGLHVLQIVGEPNVEELVLLVAEEDVLKLVAVALEDVQQYIVLEETAPLVVALLFVEVMQFLDVVVIVLRVAEIVGIVVMVLAELCALEIIVDLLLVE
jgi:hypothetical protein